MERPARRDGALVWRQTMTLSLIDHRVVDGAPAAAFLKALVEHLEHPTSLRD